MYLHSNYLPRPEKAESCRGTLRESRPEDSQDVVQIRPVYSTPKRPTVLGLLIRSSEDLVSSEDLAVIKGMFLVGF